MKLNKTKADTTLFGNYYDKYRSKNPISRYLTNGFLKSWNELISIVLKQGHPNALLETGCGDGYLLDFTQQRLKPSTITVGLEPGLLEISKTNDMLDTFHKINGSIHELPFSDQSFDVVSVPEVFEHLDDPERALKEVARVASRFIIASVPWEPIWRVMNMARGKYWRDWGNTPGHLQRFTRRGFISFMQQAVDIIDIRTPFPWTMVLGTIRH